MVADHPLVLQDFVPNDLATWPTHADLGITSAYLRGIDNTDIIHTVHERPAPMISATGGLRLAR